MEEINDNVTYGYFAFYTHRDNSKYGTISYVFHPDEYLPKRDSVIPFQKWFLKEHKKYIEDIILFCIKQVLLPYEYYL